MKLTIRYPEDNGVYFNMFRYPGGEVQVRLDMGDLFCSVTHIRVVATIRDGEVMGLVQLTDALDRATTADKTLILPYLPYGRADRAFAKGDCFGLAAFGNIINSLGYERVVTLDAHSAIAELHITNLINVSPKPIIERVLEDINGWVPFTQSAILLPDDGANRYGINTALRATKHRDPKTGKLSGFSVPPKNEFKADNILIIDDICDGGGTFVGIAEKLADYKIPIYLYVTHGIFSQGLETLHSYFKGIYTTDSFGTLPPDRLDILKIFPCMETILSDLEGPGVE